MSKRDDDLRDAIKKLKIDAQQIEMDKVIGKNISDPTRNNFQERLYKISTCLAPS
jgi:hypothetical protein